MCIRCARWSVLMPLLSFTSSTLCSQIWMALASEKDICSRAESETAPGWAWCGRSPLRSHYWEGVEGSSAASLVESNCVSSSALGQHCHLPLSSPLIINTSSPIWQWTPLIALLYSNIVSSLLTGGASGWPIYLLFLLQLVPSSARPLDRAHQAITGRIKLHLFNSFI